MAPSKENSDDGKLDRLLSAVESLQGRLDEPEVRSSSPFSADDYKELIETRLRRGIVRSVLRTSLIALALLAAALGTAGWFWMNRGIGVLADDLREKQIPAALREQVGERLNAVVVEKSTELTESFLKEMKRARWELAERFLSSGAKLQQVQGLQILRMSDDPRAVERVLTFMRRKGALTPLSIDLRRANFDYGVQALLALGSEEARTALRQIIADPGYAAGVRADAMRAAAILKDQKALPALRAALGDSDREVRLAAVNAVERMEARETWPYLVRMLSSGKHPQDFPAIIAVLKNLKVSQAAEAVVEVVQRTSKNPADLPANQKTHLEGITYFRTLEVEAALPVLFEFLMHPNPEVRLQAVAAVRQLAGSRLGTLEEWKTRDTEWRVQMVANWRRVAIASGKVKPKPGEVGVVAPATPGSPIPETEARGPRTPEMDGRGPATPGAEVPTPAGNPPESPEKQPASASVPPNPGANP